GDTPAEAHAIALGPDGSGTQSGSLEVPGDADVFRFTASISGRLAIRPEAAPGAGFDLNLTLLGAAGDQLADGPELAGVPVVAGRTYFVRVGPSYTAVPYSLSLVTSDVERESGPNDAREAASRIDPNARLSGTVDPNDVDYFATTL